MSKECNKNTYKHSIKKVQSCSNWRFPAIKVIWELISDFREFHYISRFTGSLNCFHFEIYHITGNIGMNEQLLCMVNCQAEYSVSTHCATKSEFSLMLRLTRASDRHLNILSTSDDASTHV